MIEDYDHATLLTVTTFLEGGTGDPGLTFTEWEDADLACLRKGDSDLWVVHPLTVVNIDGPHEGCVVLITMLMDSDGDMHYFFLAVDPQGQPVAYHEC